MHPIGPELSISAHMACARVCRQLYVLRASHALVQATVGVGTVILVYIGVAYTRGGEGGSRAAGVRCGPQVSPCIISTPRMICCRQRADGRRIYRKHRWPDLPGMQTTVRGCAVRCAKTGSVGVAQFRFRGVGGLRQAPAPAQHPTPRVGARPTTRALHPRTATAARKQDTRANLKGRLGLGPANGWAALSKRFRGYPNSAPTGEWPCLCSRGRHASQRQSSTQRGGSIAHNAAQHARAGRGTQ